eukprot:SAG11_NODE_1336_length_5173_cov_10.716791_6_plen_120_part_00
MWCTLSNSLLTRHNQLFEVHCGARYVVHVVTCKAILLQDVYAKQFVPMLRPLREGRKSRFIPSSLGRGWIQRVILFFTSALFFSFPASFSRYSLINLHTHDVAVGGAVYCDVVRCGFAE